MGVPLSAEPGVRSVDPAAETVLADFTCGGVSAYEREVDEIVAGFHKGASPEFLTFRVAEDEAGALVGVSATFHRPLPDLFAGPFYVGVIGVSESFRGRRLPDGERLGDFLLRDALQQLANKWHYMPWTWALIHPDNGPSQNLFDRHGFTNLGSAGNYEVWLRPGGLNDPA